MGRTSRRKKVKQRKPCCIGGKCALHCPPSPSTTSTATTTVTTPTTTTATTPATTTRMTPSESESTTSTESSESNPISPAPVRPVPTGIRTGPPPSRVSSASTPTTSAGNSESNPISPPPVRPVPTGRRTGPPPSRVSSASTQTTSTENSKSKSKYPAPVRPVPTGIRTGPPPSRAPAESTPTTSSGNSGSKKPKSPGPVRPVPTGRRTGPPPTRVSSTSTSTQTTSSENSGSKSNYPALVRPVPARTRTGPPPSRPVPTGIRTGPPPSRASSASTPTTSTENSGSKMSKSKHPALIRPVPMAIRTRKQVELPCMRPALAMVTLLGNFIQFTLDYDENMVYLPMNTFSKKFGRELLHLSRFYLPMCNVFISMWNVGSDKEPEHYLSVEGFDYFIRWRQFGILFRRSVIMRRKWEEVVLQYGLKDCAPVRQALMNLDRSFKDIAHVLQNNEAAKYLKEFISREPMGILPPMYKHEEKRVRKRGEKSKTRKCPNAKMVKKPMPRRRRSGSCDGRLEGEPTDTKHQKTIIPTLSAAGILFVESSCSRSVQEESLFNQFGFHTEFIKDSRMLAIMLKTLQQANLSHSKGKGGSSKPMEFYGFSRNIFKLIVKNIMISTACWTEDS